MDALPALQKFLVAWMDELWWSLRDRVGALSMIECIVNSWEAAGRKIGEMARQNKLKPVVTVEAVHSMLGRTVQANDDIVRVKKCPFWNRIKERGLEHAYRCEEFICAPLLAGLKDTLDAKEFTVETSLRIAHVKRSKLEFKISKLQKEAASDPSAITRSGELEKQLKLLPEHPACIFHIK